MKRAIAWVHENIKEYGGDPSYLAITGGSAGGHLAALAALTPGLKDYQPGFEDSDTSVSACVPFYGVYDLAGITEERAAVDMRDRFLGPRVFGKDPATHLDDFVQASPLAHVDEHTPDFFVIHGTNDTLVSVSRREPSSRPSARSRTPPSPTPSCPAPSTPSTCSRPSAASTRSPRCSAGCSGTAPADRLPPEGADERGEV